MKKIVNRFDKNNNSSSHSIYKLVRGNVDQYSVQPGFYKDSLFPGMIKPKSILLMPPRSHPLDFRINRAVKRCFDIFFAIIFIAGILSWLVPILAILIKLDSKGPVFFLQKRNKKNGKIFTCIKFRSMVVNEEADLVQAKKNDPRITRSGKFLRKNHLDELPQFINVLFGDMSVIGPRPHMVSDNLKFVDLIRHYSFRSKVKPGITGLAQVMGYSGPVTHIYKIKNRVNVDNFYIRHWSLKLDMAILFRTLLKTFG